MWYFVVPCAPSLIILSSLTRFENEDWQRRADWYCASQLPAIEVHRKISKNNIMQMRKDVTAYLKMEAD